MKCLACEQRIEALTPEGKCPLCASDARATRRLVDMLFVFNRVMFTSLLMWALLVAFMMKAGTVHAHPTSAAHYVFFVRALFVLAALEFLVMFSFERRAMAAQNPKVALGRFCLCRGLAIAPAMYGLMLFIMGLGARWFAILGGLSLLAATYMAWRTPVHVRHILRLAADTEPDAAELGVAEQVELMSLGHLGCALSPLAGLRAAFRLFRR